MNKQTNKAAKNLWACFSFKGNDFCCCGNRRYVKRFTSRARRRNDRAVTRDWS